MWQRKCLDTFVLEDIRRGVNRIDRLTAMIMMLQGRRVVTAQQISDHFEISVRTVYRDISALGEAGVPIVAEAGLGYSLMRGYHMPPVMFTEQEAAALFMTGEITDKYGDESLKESLRSALLKVRAALPDDRKDYLQRLGSAVEVWGSPKGLPEERSLMEVQEAVVRRRCMELSYDAGSRGEVTRRVVEALGLVFYGRHWHLIAWCRLREQFRDFRLDRMREWIVLEEGFCGHDNFSVAEFLQKEETECESTPICIECERWALERVLLEIPAKNVSREPLSGGRVEIRAEAFSLDWLVGWMLGFGTAIVVREPEELGAKIAERALEIAQQYEGSKTS